MAEPETARAIGFKLVRTLVVIPTYQEAGNIVDVLRRVRTAFGDARVLVVDDSSPDDTADIAEAAGGELGGVDVLRRRHEGGLGAAYRAGFAWGLDHGYDALVEMDADLSHDPSALPLLARALEEGADLVVGSRYMPGGVIPAWSRWRRALSRWGNRYADAVLGLGVKDATSGFRMYRAAALRTVTFADGRAGGYGFQIEMVYRFVQRGYRVVEVPITFSERSEGSSKMNGRIIAEALVLVTAWAARDILAGRLRERRRRGRREPSTRPDRPTRGPAPPAPPMESGQQTPGS